MQPFEATLCPGVRPPPQEGTPLVHSALSPPFVISPQAEQALRTFNNNLTAAASWLLNLGAVAAALPGGGQQLAAGAEAPSEEGWASDHELQRAESGEGSAAHSGGSSSEDEQEERSPARSEGLPGLESGGDSGSESDGGQPRGPTAGQAQAQAQQQQEEGAEDSPSGLADSSRESSDAEGGRPAGRGPVRQQAAPPGPAAQGGGGVPGLQASGDGESAGGAVQ